MKHPILILTIMSVFYSSCNKDQISGKIHLHNTDEVPEFSPNNQYFHTYIGDTLKMFLIPDAQFENIYGISWEVQPQTYGSIVYKEQPDRSMKDFKEDREAVFIPKLDGECTIYVYGYYKQTNPQLIDSVKIVVIRPWDAE
jgi:hypothetical protein